MGSFANSIFNLLLGWVRAAARSLWALISGEGGDLLTWIGENWLALTVVICAVCTVIDVIIHVIRWRPYKVWASFLRRITGQEKQHETRREPRHERRVTRPETEPEPQWEPSVTQTEEAPPPAPAMEDQAAYRSRFARPVQEQSNYQRPPEMDRLQYQQLPQEKPEPVNGPAGYPKPVKTETEAVPEPVQQENFYMPGPRESLSEQMRRRMSQLQKNRGITEDGSELEYHPAQPMFDKEEMYHAPVYPPNWQEPPAATETRTIPRRRTQHHEINRNA